MDLHRECCARFRAGRRRKASSTKDKKQGATSTRGRASNRLRQQSSKLIFPFLSLPKETQLEIFEMIFLGPHTIPIYYPKYLRGTVDIDYRSDPGYWSVRRDVTHFLLTCHHIYHHFAPLYWQRKTLLFSNPVKLANGFLDVASSIACSNIRYMNWRVDLFRLTAERREWNGHHPLEWEFEKLGEIICTHPVLKALRSLHIEFNALTFLDEILQRRIPGRCKEPNADDLWTAVDREYHDCFSKMQKRVLRMTFRGFRVHSHVELCSEEQIVHERRWIRRLHMDFDNERPTSVITE